MDWRIERFSGVQQRLWVVFALTLIPALLLFSGSFFEERTNNIKQAREEVTRVVRLFSARQQAQIESTRVLLSVLANMPAVKNHDLMGCSRVFSDIVEKDPTFANIRLNDLDGNVLCSGVPFSGILNTRDWPAFSWALAQRDFVVGDYRIGVVTGKPSLHCGCPIFDDEGKMTAVLLAALDLKWLNQFAHEARLPEGASLTVMDGNGTVLAREPNPELWVGKSYVDHAVLKAFLKTRGEGTVTGVGLDGIERLYAYTKLTEAKGVPICVYSGIPHAVIVRSANRMMAFRIWILAGIMIIGLGAGWLVSRRTLVQPVMALLEAARRLGTGDFSARTGLRHSKDEFGQLAASFDRMASHIEEHWQELTRAEQEVRRFKVIADNAHYGMVILDTAHTVLYANKAFAEMHGGTETDVLGKPYSVLHHCDTRCELDIALERLQKEGVLDLMEIRHCRPDGAWFPVLVHGVVARQSSGEPEFMALLSADASERAALEEQFRQMQKMESIGRLAGGVAHDFNNLLSVILGYGEMLEREVDGEQDKKEMVSEILHAGERAKNLTMQLLAFSRKQIMQMEVLNLNHVIEDMEKMLRRLIGEDIVLSLHLGTDLAFVQADPAQLQQVLLNLVVNARDAMPQGGKIFVETANTFWDCDYARKHANAHSGPYVMLAISDTGNGMDEETKRHVFEPFFTTKPKGQGTGLGLSTVDGIVRQHGGHIHLYSEPGRGTTFRIYFETVDSKTPSAKEEAPVADDINGTETVLVVEDEDNVRSLICGVLRKHGYRIIEAVIPEEAVYHARQAPGEIDLLLTDVVMPNFNGRQVYEQVSALRPNIRVLYMSGYADELIAHHGLISGEFALIQKPFTLQGLLKAVRNALTPSSSSV